ncbi:alpha/beta hydrolase-fold protein [Flammeovirga sp. SJP92]|uniref:alpha/beta hydrolase-fold protein n=1 Tax=Flammeovirga sp. SJP92 TaxID=1775430 RepID=UPI000B008575|nr:alpha/beta hydrolase-fold protein [Flammeovirga sp. SJP92]
MKKIILLTITLFMPFWVLGQSITSITVTVPNATDEVYITGDQKNLGKWDPKKIKMVKVSDHKREIQLELSYPATFKFTRGNWDSEGFVEDIDMYSNITVTKYSKQLHYEIERWSDEKMTNGKFALKYDVEYITSKYYPDEERPLRIFLPKKYDASKKYPVIYILDGEALFDLSISTVSILQANADQNSNIIPECIVVGIDNVDRSRDLRPNWGSHKQSSIDQFTAEGEKFYKIIKEEIVPFINKNYSVSNHNTLIGHSDAAHFVTNVYLKDNEVFDGIIALSVNDFENYFQQNFYKNKKAEKDYFLGYGSKDNEFNVFGPYLAEITQSGNIVAKKYNADHIALPYSSLLDAVKFIFRDFKNYDALIAQTYNDAFSYKQFEDAYSTTISNKYGINTPIGFDVSYLLNQARDQKNTLVFNKLLDEIEQSKVFQLQLLFYYSEEYDQDDRALKYLYQMLESNDQNDKFIFYANLNHQYKDFFVSKLSKTNEFIEFIEKAKKKWPEFKLEFNYTIIKTVKEQNISFDEYEKYFKYCQKNYYENRYFDKKELTDIQ